MKILNLKSNWRKFTTKHRFRFEQRFIHKNLTTDQFQNWLRYDLNISYPLSKLGALMLLMKYF